MPLRPRRAAAALRDMGMSQLDAGELAPEEAAYALAVAAADEAVAPAAADRRSMKMRLTDFAKRRGKSSKPVG